MRNCNNTDIPLEISMEYPLYQSRKGNYFIGQTPVLTETSPYALGMLRNLYSSNRIIYLNAITITNYSDENLSAEFYLRSKSCKTTLSDLISCTNTFIHPAPDSKGTIQYAIPSSAPLGGIPIFTRIVGAYSTLVVDGGQIILGPDQSIIVFIGGFNPVPLDGIRFAFGWWEKKTASCQDDPKCE